MIGLPGFTTGTITLSSKHTNITFSLLETLNPFKYLNEVATNLASTWFNLTRYGFYSKFRLKSTRMLKGIFLKSTCTVSLHGIGVPSGTLFEI